MIIAGGINFYGLSKLIFLDGTMNVFSYGQDLLFYKEDIEKIEKENKVKIMFEQDGAASHKNKSNLFLLNKLFGNGGWSQNPPSSPDLAYLIEDIWGIIKPRVKRREPKTIEELKNYLLDEWNSVPKDTIKNLCQNWLERVKKVLELNGGRIELEYFKKKEKMDYKWEESEKQHYQRIVYNDENLRIYKEKEIKILKKNLKEKKIQHNQRMKEIGKKIESFRKKDLKMPSIGKTLSILREREKLIEEQKNSKENKEKIDEEFNEKINNISKMNIFEYLRHLNGDEDYDVHSDSTDNETVEDKVDNLEELIKNNKENKYRKLGKIQLN